MTERIQNSENIENTAPVLAIEELSVSIGGRRVLDSLSFSFDRRTKGGVHGILAPAGSGKSTLLSAMAGVIPTEGGRVMLCGRDMLEDIGVSKRKIGYVPEKPAFYGNMSVRETLEFVGESKRITSERRYKQIKEAISLVGLEDIQNRLTRNLRADEARRLSIACALLGNPDILIFDEVMSGSAESKAAIGELIKMIGGIKTVVLSTADIATARELCEDVAILSDGRLMACDTFEGLEAKLLRHRALKLTTRADADKVTSAIEKICGVVGCEVAKNPRTEELRIRIEHRSENDIREDVSKALAELEAPVLSMSNCAISLDDIYLSLVSAGANEKLSLAVEDEEDISAKTKKFGKRIKGGRK